jgi:hypothetical protein
MKAKLLIFLAIFAACASAITIGTAVAHRWVPVYDGAAWGNACLVPSPRTTPVTCCGFTRSTCEAACGLPAEVGDAWKNACRANCQSAGNACLQRVQGLPPTTSVRPGSQKPPASPN